ncbi:hypothetical protein [Archangium lipolyticum]|uniref:hypothetical protein n=1 Tax=Archangium lipolyticum TaxID=2970465 RepID=UPI00214A75D2|nr:hypothetical protein [Archangium lipolyticum]
MPLSTRSHNMFQQLPRVCCGVLSALLVLAAPVVEAAPKSSKKSARTSASKKASKTAKTAPAAQPESAREPAPSTPAPPPAEAPAAAAAPAVESKPEEAPPRPALEPKPVVAARPAASRPAASRSTPPARSTPAPAPASSPIASGRTRVGVGGDVFLESSRMTGEQGINTSRRDESFDYSSAGFLSATAWLNTPVTVLSNRLRVGAGLRIFGNYAAGGGREFGFGLLNEVFISGEYGLPVADKTEVTFGGRVGMSLLVPNREFAAEIRRLQEQGVHVWSLPRVGWLAGPTVGARRQMTDRIWLRADVVAQVEQQYLFFTSQELSGLRFTKNWSTLGLRLGLTLGAEFAL